MDPNLRRVYYTVGGILFVLWLGLVTWVVKTLNPEILAFFTAPAVPSSPNLQGIPRDFHIPGIQFSVYRTLPGETYSRLSQKLGLAETTLRSINLANDDSEPKTDVTLLIPSKDGVYHIARPGQGLADIARAYGIPLREILRANQKRGDSDLRPDDVLFLPGARYLSKKDRDWVTLALLETTKGFLKPTTGRFADGFGERVHPLTHKMAFHEGLDLAPGWRARVVAAQGGTVIFGGIKAGYGRLIILDHGLGLTSWYAHLDEILVKPQQAVTRGQLIGKVGKSGRTTGPHLHFEVRLNGKPQNPFLYLAQ